MKFKRSKNRLYVGLLAILFGILAEIFLISLLLNEGTMGIIVGILFFIFFCCPFMYGGISCIKGYYCSANSINKVLERYGQENIVKHIESATIFCYAYPFSNRKVYFTSHYIIDPNAAIINYNDISFVHKEITTGSIKKPYIVFELLDGTRYSLCDYANDDIVLYIIKLCHYYNPKILYENTKDNRLIHKNNVKAYKSGTTNTIAKQTEFDTPYEYTAKGKKHIKAHYMMYMGGMCLLFSIICIITLPFVMNSEIDEKVNPISEDEREELLDEGYKEYRVIGKYLYRKNVYRYGNESKLPYELYIYNLENEKDLYLGVVGEIDYNEYNTSVCDGFSIFYKGDVLKDTVEGNGKSYKLEVIKKSDMCLIFGIPSKESQDDKVINVVVSLVISISMFIVGVVLVIIGKIKLKRI